MTNNWVLAFYCLAWPILVRNCSNDAGNTIEANWKKASFLCSRWHKSNLCYVCKSLRKQIVFHLRNRNDTFCKQFPNLGNNAHIYWILIKSYKMKIHPFVLGDFNGRIWNVASNRNNLLCILFTQVYLTFCYPNKSY